MEVEDEIVNGFDSRNEVENDEIQEPLSIKKVILN